jgi:hypothetical protein
LLTILLVPTAYSLVEQWLARIHDYRAARAERQAAEREAAKRKAEEAAGAV